MLPVREIASAVIVDVRLRNPLRENDVAMDILQGWGRYFISVPRYKVKKYSKKVTKYK